MIIWSAWKKIHSQEHIQFISEEPTAVHVQYFSFKVEIDDHVALTYHCEVKVDWTV